MREIKPYRSLEALRAAIDNGGRWYHLFAREGDGQVSAGELKKAAETMGEQHAMLFLALAASRLSAEEQRQLSELLELPLRLRRLRPETMCVAQFEQQAEGGTSALVSGRLHRWCGPNNLRLLQKVAVKSMVVATAYQPVPITQVYDLYELRDAGATVPVGVARGEQVPLEEPICIAGNVEELTFVGKQPTHHFLLVGAYYSRIPASSAAAS